jgi:N-acetylglucosaminyl-diphospho-decaprenol L-rhamnosyltransferase
MLPTPSTRIIAGDHPPYFGAVPAGEREVTVAVVSYNTRELLLQCLASLAADAACGRAEVWVADNASTDGSAVAVREHAPWAHVIETGGNLGFGRAINLIAERTAGDWLLIANADIALREGSLAALVSAGRDARVGCVAPRLCSPDGRSEHSVHPFPTLPVTVAFNLGLQRVVPGLGERLCLEGYWDPGRARTVPWAIGACLLVRRRAFSAVGGFDERQWLYAEDLELGWRLRDAGSLTKYEPGARVVHVSGAATSIAFGGQRVDRFTRETYDVLRRRRGGPRATLTAAVNVAGAAARVAWMAPLTIVSHRWRERSAAARAWFTAHRRGLRIAAGGAPETPGQPRS